MSIVSVLAIIDGGPSSETVIQSALRIGRRLNAITTLMQITPPDSSFAYPFAEFASSTVIQDLVEKLDTESHQRVQRFNDLYQKHVISTGLPTARPSKTRFHVRRAIVHGHEGREIARHGRLHDLIIVGAPEPGTGGVDSTVIESALLDTARPVLIPPRNQALCSIDRITIAWDGSREAALSIRNALPILSQAMDIEVVNVAVSDDTDPLDISDYLEDHGIKTTCRTIDAGNAKVADTLVNAARTNGDAVLVMGAYGQNAVTEAIFGGVTRAALQSGAVTLLLSH